MSISSFFMSVGGELESEETKMSMTLPHSWRATAANHAPSDVRKTRSSRRFSVATYYA